MAANFDEAEAWASTSESCTLCGISKDECTCDGAVFELEESSEAIAEVSDTSEALTLLMILGADQGRRLSERAAVLAAIRDPKNADFVGKSPAPLKDLPAGLLDPSTGRLTKEGELAARLLLPVPEPKLIVFAVEILKHLLSVEGEDVSGVLLKELSKDKLTKILGEMREGSKLVAEYSDRSAWKLTWGGRGWGSFSSQSPNERARVTRVQLNSACDDFGIVQIKLNGPGVLLIAVPEDAEDAEDAEAAAGAADVGLEFELDDVDGAVARALGGTGALPEGADPREDDLAQEFSTLDSGDSGDGEDFEPARRGRCLLYAACLDAAIAREWRGFHCLACDFGKVHGGPMGRWVTSMDENSLLNVLGRQKE